MWLLAMTRSVLALARFAVDTAPTEPTDLPGLPPLAQYGIGGVVLVAVLTRKIVAGWQFDRLEKEYQELKQENRDLVQLNFETQQKVLPALEASSRALEETRIMLEVRRRDRERGDRNGEST